MRPASMPRHSAKQTRTRLKMAGHEAVTETTAPAPCPLCGRPLLPGPSVDEHHLVPKSRRGREKFLVHRICHTKIHATLSEKNLATEYHTWDALRAHPEIAAFVAWVQKRPPEFMARNAASRNRR
jgi:hypothetical protein